jgi:hypothetical protein
MVPGHVQGLSRVPPTSPREAREASCIREAYGFLAGSTSTTSPEGLVLVR